MSESNFRANMPLMAHGNAKSSRLTRILSVIGLALIVGGSLGSKIADDETVLFFPSYATQSGDGKSWQVRLHAWVFELESPSILRAGLLKAFSLKLGTTDAESGSETFKSRARYFIVDNERGKEFPISIAGYPFVLGPSGTNGHMFGAFSVPSEVVNQQAEVNPSGRRRLWVNASIGPSGSPPQKVDVVLLEPTGAAVISDIDDTVKVSDVLSKKALLKNTFVQDYTPVPGMSEAYRRWGAAGASFHYVSASPWQLYPALSDFFAHHQFPLHSIAMKGFRWKDSSFFDLFVQNDGYKMPLIEELMAQLPHRSFFLIGDSGERDLRLYCSIARKHPTLVKGIFIRKTPGTNLDVSSIDEECSGLPNGLVRIFETASELPISL